MKNYIIYNNVILGLNLHYQASLMVIINLIFISLGITNVK
jgi:hypothetical protein